MEISIMNKERLEEMCKHMKPLIRVPSIGYEGTTLLKKHKRWDLYYILDVDPNIPFKWDFELTEKAKGLLRFKNITTFHSYSNVGLFRPTIAEVISQIPEEYLESVVGFETNYSGLTGEYHRAKTTLYKRKNLRGK